MLWLILALLTLAVIAVLVLPFVRANNELRRRADYDMVVYRNQLAEIDQEIDDGQLTPEEADAARAEVHRRMLAAEDAELERPLGRLPGSGRYARIAAIVAIAVAVPVGAAAMYAHLGSPNLPGKPYLWRVHNDPEFATAATADVLASEVQAKPTAAGFAGLGRTYFAARQYELAAAAYRRAFELGANDPVSWSEFGEAVVLVSGGAVVPEAMTAFFNAYSLEPRSERARFYLGLAEAQIGNVRQAVAIWRDLEKTSPADAPWLPMVREHIQTFAKQGGFDPASVPPSPPDIKAMGTALAAMGKAMQTGPAEAAPAPPDMSATTAAVARDPMVVEMVQRLADKMEKNPTDVAGWQRLAHAYVVLGETAKARTAIDRAVAQKPNDVGVLLALAEVQKAAAPQNEAPKDMVATMRKVLALDAANPPALYYVGIAEAGSGHADQAKAMWTKALKNVSPDDPLAVEIHRKLSGASDPKN